MNDVPEPEDLLCEYRTTEIHVATLTAGVFQSAAIIVGGSIAALAVLLGVRDTVPVAVAVTFLALGAIYVTEMWRLNWKRHKASIDRAWIRMREIELKRGMRKNIYLYLLTRGEKERAEIEQLWLGKHEQERFHGIYESIPDRRTGQEVLQTTARLVQLGWVLIVVFKWLDVPW